MHSAAGETQIERADDANLGSLGSAGVRIAAAPANHRDGVAVLLQTNRQIRQQLAGGRSIRPEKLVQQ